MNSSVLLLAGGGVLAYFIVRILYGIDTRREDRRRRAITLSTWAAKNGLPEFSELFSSYAVEDRVGTIRQLRSLADLVADNERAQAAVQHFLKVQLDQRLADTDKREELLRYLEDKLEVQVPRKKKP